MSKIKTNTIENVAGDKSVTVAQLELKSPDGSQWKLVVSDVGVLTVEKVT